MFEGLLLLNALRHSIVRDFRVDHAKQQNGSFAIPVALKVHRMLIFGTGSSFWAHQGKMINRKKVVKVLEAEQGQLAKAAILRCRLRYFTSATELFGARLNSFVDSRLSGEWGRVFASRA